VFPRRALEERLSLEGTDFRGAAAGGNSLELGEEW
jgi:hypothetical protein